MIARKLHLKPGMRVAVANAPAGFSLGDVPGGLGVKKSLAAPLDLAFIFARDSKELVPLWSKAIAAVNQEGAVWVAYPKKGSGIQTDLGMGEWEATRGSEWNPVSMIGVDDVWSAVRFRHAPGLEEERHNRQTQAMTDADGTVCVDRVNRLVTAPGDLQARLTKNARARTAFDGLSFTHRKEYVVWILEAKKPETRAARVTRTVEMLAEGRKNPSDR